MAPRLSETLLDRVRATRTIEPGARLVVMLSGGRDSACLTKLAVDLSAEVTALHVNHGLRGAESAVDEAHCRELCAGLGVGLVVEHAGPAAPGNTHAWARDVRYDAGVALAQRNDAALAVAHTETDQLETILYRLASSPGRRALLGMAVRRGRIVRPLLAARVTRAETEAFCRENGLSWRDDASNLDPSYARTRVREQLLPAFLAVDDRARENVLRTAELLRAEGEVLDELVETFLAGRDHVGRDELRALSPALARLVIRTLAERVTGSGGARAASRIDDVLALDEGLLDLGDGARVEVRRGTVRFISSPSG